MELKTSWQWIGRRIDMIDRMINETFEEAVNE